MHIVYGMISMTFLADRGVVELWKRVPFMYSVLCTIRVTDIYVTFSVFPLLSSYISHRIWHYGARSGLHISFLFLVFSIKLYWAMSVRARAQMNANKYEPSSARECESKRTFMEIRPPFLLHFFMKVEVARLVGWCLSFRMER